MKRVDGISPPASLAHVAVSPILESMPLRELILLCQTNKEFAERYKLIMSDIARRLVEEQPLFVLRKCAINRATDYRLRLTCCHRLGPSPITISAGYNHCLALLANGEIIGWGSDVHGEISGSRAALPDGRHYVAIAAGSEFSVGILDNGHVVQWGLAGGDVPVLPEGRRCVSVSARSHVLALLDDGQVVGWRANGFRQSTGGADALPAGRRYVAISAGCLCSLGLLDDGRVVSWGLRATTLSHGAAVALPKGRRYVSISAGDGFGVGLLDNGHIVDWGYGVDSRSVRSGADVNNLWYIRQGKRFIGVSAGMMHALALLDNGHVVGWRNDEASDDSSDGENEDIAEATHRLQDGGGRRYLDISAGSNISMGLGDNLQVIRWGRFL